MREKVVNKNMRPKKESLVAKGFKDFCQGNAWRGMK